VVTFCTVCGTSLPLADVLIQQGKELTSPDYRCPECGDFAAEEAHKKQEVEEFDVADDGALVVRAGIEETRTGAELAGMFSGNSRTRAASAPAHAPPAAQPHAAPAPVDAAEEVVMPPDEDLLAQAPQPSLPLVPATDEEVQEDLLTDLPTKVAPEEEEDDELDFIERPE